MGGGGWRCAACVCVFVCAVGHMLWWKTQPCEACRRTLQGWAAVGVTGAVGVVGVRA
jgi:hypothetical protein